eukprot:m.422195 g.422195  ORF g.422195 m.422195 type:complete len:55 (-) comp16852_c0_seq5:1558-1722(-)
MARFCEPNLSTDHHHVLDARVTDSDAADTVTQTARPRGNEILRLFLEGVNITFT